MEPCLVAIVTSAMGSTICGPVTRGWGGCGFYLVSGWTGLTPEPCSLGLALGQGSASELAYSKPITRCKNERGSHQIPGRAPAGSLGRWDGPWTVAEKDWNHLPGLFRIHSQDQCLQTWYWRDGWVCPPPDPTVGGTASWQWLGWPGAKLEGSFRI